MDTETAARRVKALAKPIWPARKANTLIEHIYLLAERLIGDEVTVEWTGDARKPLKVAHRVGAVELWSWEDERAWTIRLNALAIRSILGMDDAAAADVLWQLMARALESMTQIDPPDIQMLAADGDPMERLHHVPDDADLGLIIVLNRWNATQEWLARALARTGRADAAALILHPATLRKAEDD